MLHSPLVQKKKPHRLIDGLHVQLHLRKRTIEFTLQMHFSIE